MNRKYLIDRDAVDILDSPEDVLSTLTREGKRKWVYPTLSRGRFYKPRLWLGWFLIILFVALPMIPVGGQPAVLLDFIHREFALFGLTFYPTDTLLLLLSMVGTVIGVILITALLGRVWCGWGCPQTVYLEFVFRPLERWIEGKEHIRKHRHEGPWTWDKIWRKSAKLSLFLLISLGLAHVFVSYFVGWERLLAWMQAPPRDHWGFFVMMAFTTGLILFDFGYFREQMCTITCPYARLQSVLVDPNSLIVSYDANRGEPRARRSKKKIRDEEAGLVPAQGDCIDCFACVRTCPTGIDIRDGLQMECIACTQCIDACDAIMENIGKPKGLIRYTSEQELAGQPTRWLRPRTVLYTVVGLGIALVFTGLLITRNAYDVNVGRVVGAPFTELPDGRIANRLRFRVRNQQPYAATFTIEAAAPAGTEVRIVGASPIALAPQEMKRVEAWIVVPRARFSDDSLEGVFRLTFDDGTAEEVTFTLLGPSE
jgi:cytochrome c oxidase accessory protein FixG